MNKAAPMVSSITKEPVLLNRGEVSILSFSLRNRLLVLLRSLVILAHGVLPVMEKVVSDG